MKSQGSLNLTHLDLQLEIDDYYYHSVVVDDVLYLSILLVVVDDVYQKNVGTAYSKDLSVGNLNLLDHRYYYYLLASMAAEASQQQLHYPYMDDHLVIVIVDELHPAVVSWQEFLR